MREDYELKLVILGQEIRRSRFIQLRKFSPVQLLSEVSLDTFRNLGFPPSFIEVYPEIAEFAFEWELIHPMDEDLRGYLSFGKLENINRRIADVMFPNEVMEEGDPLYNFHVVDYHNNQHMIGIYSGAENDDSLYVYNTEDTERLHLNLTGYVEMLVLSKGFEYWHQAIFEILRGEENEESCLFKEVMPQLFPGWSWETFVAKYEEVRLR